MADTFPVACQHCGREFDSGDKAFAKCPGCGRMLTLFPKPRYTEVRLQARVEALSASLREAQHFVSAAALHGHIGADKWLDRSNELLQQNGKQNGDD